jgi:outer membrane lipopolysaccharide assembly protein LptE/RlpB
VKKILIINLLFFLLLGCGFKPIYSKNKKFDFYIESLNFNNSDRELANFVKTNLNNYMINNNGRKFKIEASIDFNKNSISKDISGNTEEYELSSILNFVISSNELSKKLSYQQVSRMKNLTDEFKELQYERSIKKNMAQSISSRLIMQLSILNAN